MPDPTTFDSFTIKVDGRELSPEVADDLNEVVVEDDLAQPAMFTLRFHDPNFALIDSDQFKLGSEVVVTANKKNQHKMLLTAEVTSIESILDQHLTLLLIRGYDRSHRLYRGHQTRTFLKQTDSQIAHKIASEAGLSADIQATTEQFEYVIQENQTDMEFLRSRAARIGYRVLGEGRKLVFRHAEATPQQATPQTWGTSLLSFRSRTTAVAQPNEVQVRGWDPKTKQAIVGKATAAAKTSQVGDGVTGGDAAKKAFGTKATVMETHQPIDTQAGANRMAQAVLDQMTGDYLSAEGYCYGEPTLKAGTLVEIKGIGKRLSGKYFVTATRHTFTQRDGYMTTFFVNGQRPQSLLAVNSNGNRSRHTRVGVVVGIVTNNNDPDKQGRVKVKFPWLDEQEESNWARLAMPGAGAKRGLIAVPEVNDEVLVAFEHGDMHRPFIVGGLWNGKDAPPMPTVKNGKVEFRSLVTRVGHEIMFQDGEGASKGLIQIKTAGGNTIKISDTDKNIQIKSQNHTILLDDQGRAVKIQSAGELEISGTGGKLKIGPSGVELTSTSAIKVQASAKLDLQANGMVDVKSSGILNIQGTLVKIN